MAETTSGVPLSTKRLILVPAVITLAVTILRLVGELADWAPLLFNHRFGPKAGGGGTIVGIVWLVPIFGIYFALKLLAAGERPPRVGYAIKLSALGVIILLGGGLAGFALQAKFPFKLWGMVATLALMAVGVAVQFPAWPALGKTLLAYAYAARIPVAVVMFFAKLAGWRTHYDVLPPGLPAMSFWQQYVRTALLPQLIFWVVFTIVEGMLFGTIVAAIARRTEGAPQAAS